MFVVPLCPILSDFVGRIRAGLNPFYLHLYTLILLRTAILASALARSVRP